MKGMFDVNRGFTIRDHDILMWGPDYKPNEEEDN